MRLSRRSFLAVLPAPLVPGFLRSEDWVPDNNNPFAEPPPNVNPNEPVIPPVFVERRDDARWKGPTKTQWDAVMAALEQHGILSANNTPDSPHPDLSLRTLRFGGGKGYLDDNGMRLTYPNAIYWSTLLSDPVPTYPYAKISSDAGLTYPGTTIEFLEQAFIDANDYTKVRQYVDPALSGSLITIEVQNSGNSETLFLSRGGVLSNGLTVSADLYATKKMSIGDFSTKTIATGAITITTSAHKVDTESAAASDDLDTVTGGLTGQVLVLTAASSARTVVCTEAGNMKLAGGSMSLDNAEDSLTLIYNGSSWVELCRSDNGA